MDRSDSQALAAIYSAIQQDVQVREDIRRSLESHDRAFLALVVGRVVSRLRLSVPDMGELVERAYERFRDRL